MGIKERQDRERQAVRLAILDAARDLFVDEGYRNVSIRKIAERIEYSPAAIYSYFASKDDIFFALAEEGFRRLDAKVRGVLGHDDPLEEVRACWWAYYEFSREQREFFELMFVDRSVPQITEQWTGLAFVHQMLEFAAVTHSALYRCGHLPRRHTGRRRHAFDLGCPDRVRRSSAADAASPRARIPMRSRAMCSNLSLPASRPVRPPHSPRVRQFR